MANLSKRSVRSAPRLANPGKTPPTPKYMASNGMHETKSMMNHFFKYRCAMKLRLYTSSPVLWCTMAVKKFKMRSMINYAVTT